MSPILQDLHTPPRPPGASEDRLDRLLASALGLSRSAIRRMLAAGEVWVNGRPVGPEAKGRPVRAEDRVQIQGDRSAGPGVPIAEGAAPLTVLARGDGWMAIDKPPGQAVHPYRGNETGTVLNALVAREPGIVEVGEGGLRGGVVHRLDVDTSGVLLFALDSDLWRRARGAFSAGRAAKRYRALVAGCLEGSGSGRFNLFVAQHRPARVRVAGSASKQKSWPTTLRWRALENFEEATLVEIAPKTGFLHQIRVCLSELGHPVLGDAVYGGVEAGFAARTGVRPGRHLLHAAELAIPEIEGLETQSPDPADFRRVLRTLRGV